MKRRSRGSFRRRGRPGGSRAGSGSIVPRLRLHRLADLDDRGRAPVRAVLDEGGPRRGGRGVCGVLEEIRRSVHGRAPRGERDFPQKTAHLAFPILDRPATKEDVRAAGRSSRSKGRQRSAASNCRRYPSRRSGSRPRRRREAAPRTVGCGRPRRYAKAASGSATTASSDATSSRGSRADRSSWPAIGGPPPRTADGRPARVLPAIAPRQRAFREPGVAVEGDVHASNRVGVAQPVMTPASLLRT